MSCCVVHTYILSVDKHKIPFFSFVCFRARCIGIKTICKLPVCSMRMLLYEKSCPTGELPKYPLPFRNKSWFTSKLQTMIIWPHYQSIAEVPLSKIPNHIMFRAPPRDSCLTLTPLPRLLHVFILCLSIHYKKYIFCIITSKNSKFPSVGLIKVFSSWFAPLQLNMSGFLKSSDFILYIVSVFYVQIEVKKRFNG